MKLNWKLVNNIVGPQCLALDILYQQDSSFLITFNRKDLYFVTLV